MVDVLADLLDQDGDRGESAAPDGLTGDDAEPGLDLVDPGRADRREVEVHVWVALEPRRDLGGGVRGQVVQHDVHVGARVRLDGLLQEGEEVRTVAGGLALPEHLAGGHVQRGEQVRRAVPHVVVGALLGRVERDRQHRLGPVQGLDLRFLIDREHHRSARLSRPGARCRRYRRSVSPGRSPNPACASPRTGLSTVTVVKRWLRWPRGWGSWYPGSDTE